MYTHLRHECMHTKVCMYMCTYICMEYMCICVYILIYIITNTCKCYWIVCWMITAPGIFVGSYISSPENLWLPENMLGQNDPGMSVDSRTLPKIVLDHKTVPEIPPCVGPSTAHVCCSWYPPAHDAGPQLPLRLACKVWHRHCTQSIHHRMMHSFSSP